MDVQRHISATAFLVNESRARMVSLSRDIYANHWVRPEHRNAVRELWEDFAQEVYPHDDLELSIRNRYFLDRLQAFVCSHEDPVFINIGAGFTSYPFLVDRPIQCIEIDYPEVVACKKARLAALQDARIIPRRAIKFVTMDLNDPKNRRRFRDYLVSNTSGRPSYVLLEGLTYYLQPATLNALFKICGAIQPRGSRLAFDFWKPDMVSHPVFLRLQRFFADRFGYARQDYNLFAKECIETIQGYRLQEISSAAAQERTYAGSSVLKAYEKILPEHYAVLTKR
jgi:O-methyltransferase involved in polyketide biosynthesis